MNEIDPGLRLIGLITFLGAMAGPMIWFVIQRGFWIMTSCVVVIILIGATLCTWWAASSGITSAYRGEAPSFVHFLLYYVETMGRVFVGFIAAFWLARRFAPKMK